MDTSPPHQLFFIFKMAAVPTWTKLRQGGEAHKQTQCSQQPIFIAALQIHKASLTQSSLSLPYAHVNLHRSISTLQPYEV